MHDICSGITMKKYTEDHEWIVIDQDNNGTVATVGITQHAATQLGDLVYIELPSIDDTVNKGDEAVVIESVKAAGEVLAPCTGKIIAINEALQDDAEITGNDPEGEGWLFKIALDNPSELESTMTEEEYTAFNS